MAKRVIFKLMDIVMFVLTSNPAAINRMKARKGGFFKGTVIKVTRTHVWVKPANETLLERLKNTCFFQQAIQSGDKFITKENLNKMGYCLESDDLHAFHPDYLKNLFKGGKVVDYVSIPKKQVDHFYGERKRMEMALDKLSKSDLVKKHTKKTKTKKDNTWTYNV